MSGCFDGTLVPCYLTTSGFAENDEKVAVENYVGVGNILINVDFALIGHKPLGEGVKNWGKVLNTDSFYLYMIHS